MGRACDRVRHDLAKELKEDHRGCHRQERDTTPEEPEEERSLASQGL